MLAAAATSLLPGWARRPLYLPRLPLTEAALVRPAGHAVIHGDPLGDQLRRQSSSVAAIRATCSLGGPNSKALLCARLK